MQMPQRLLGFQKQTGTGSNLQDRPRPVSTHLIDCPGGSIVDQTGLDTRHWLLDSDFCVLEHNATMISLLTPPQYKHCSITSLFEQHTMG